MSISLIQLDFPELFLIPTKGDSHCFFHCLLFATSQEYQNLTSEEKTQQAVEFRKYLSRVLELEISGKIVYDKLSRGNLREFGNAVPEFSLESMKAELCSPSFVDNKYNELVSNTLNVDIYLIDSKTQDFYVSGNDVDLYYHNRPSIVILYDEDGAHYSLVGYREKDVLKTIFPWDHRFIKCLRRRMKVLLGLK